jgi:hypothetical protein
MTDDERSTLTISTQHLCDAVRFATDGLVDIAAMDPHSDQARRAVMAIDAVEMQMKECRAVLEEAVS